MRNRAAWLVLLALVAFVMRLGPALAADRPFDPVTGRDTRDYPPDAGVDFQHIRLDLRMPDPMSRSFHCEETITFRAPQRPIDRIDFDAMDLSIDSVTDNDGHTLSHRHDGKRLTIRFAKPIEPSAESTVKIAYACSSPVAGMIFALPDDAYRDRPLMIHTQGQAETNRFWFACHDYPNEMQTTELLVTIPSKYSALSNGALTEKRDVGDGLTQWHHKLGRPHVSYLVSLVIGDFAVVTDTWRGKPVEYWVAKSNDKNARRTFGRTPEMMELFSKLTGFDYPWEKYAQAVVYNFEAGGMENTSCTTLVETTDVDERAALDSDCEGLIAHELAHQWFGDALTCRSWAHTWLNEGFATFMEKCWQEHAHGDQEYAYAMWTTMRGVADVDDVAARGGLVWPYYDPANPFEAFGRSISNPYSKGASVLHMLRRGMGDELFWVAIREYVKRHAFGNVESDDLRRACEDVSGRSFEHFFQQWVYRAGSPHIKVGYEWDDAQKQVTVTLEQTQTISETAPAFEADVQVCLMDEAAKIVARPRLHVDGRRAQITIPCEREPAQVIVDPTGNLLAKWDRSAISTKLLIEQAKNGPAPVARLDAIAALADRDRDDVRAILKSILLDDREHRTTRGEAAKALGRMQQPAARDVLIESVAEGRAIAEPRVRRAAIEALGQYARDEKVVPTLLRYARHDETYGVEAAATAALGGQHVSDEVIEALIANTKKPSFRDQIRSDAARSLASLEDPRGVEPVRLLAQYGQPYRLRPTAIESLGKLATALDKRAALRDELLAFTADPQPRSVTAAIKALGDLGDDKALPRLKAIMNGSAPPRVRDAAKNAIEAIAKKPGTNETIKSLRDRVEALEKAQQHVEAKSPTTTPTSQP